MNLSTRRFPILFLLPAVFLPCVAAAEESASVVGRLRKTLERQLSFYWKPSIPSLGLTCIDNSVRAGGDKDEDYTCITEGESICIDYEPHAPMGGRWSFGVKDGYVHLWNPKNEIVWSYCRTVTHVCIGEEQGFDPNKFSEERPYMFFYDEKSQSRVGELTCDGTDGVDGENLGQSSIIKLIDNSEIGELAEYPISIVKFKKGQTPDPEDDNSLWWIEYDANNVGTFQYNSDKCTWTERALLFAGQAFSSLPAYLIDLDAMTYSTENAFIDVNGVNGAAFNGVGCHVYFSSFADGSSNNLFTWSLTSPEAEPVLVGKIFDNNGDRIRVDGLAFSDGDLYASDQNDGLYRVDPSLNAELILPYGPDIGDDPFIGGIASDSLTGVIYGLDDRNRKIVRFDLDTMAIVTVASYPSVGGGLVSDIDGLAAGNGMLYLVIDEPGNFYVYDLAKQEYGEMIESPFPSGQTFSGAAYVTGSGVGEN
mmetsp:Transcript_3562/g.6188  ORF Transcript_3562/g.6188 Transcript_3562/m.6188 type:complete len:479 (-) Transcript_3562:134-1570(-)|eukprot:CAMPEP_0197721022 /NCGR_PEP_ID=MMETSP1434-20131217/4203_1 /TAXON_ID=265543 /ORGANISM="Minutocellus polymorphus, Strain CCMP3303" /LENGTH=478 /DNA_ID=CAMNT_0043305961 /DNA_START=38 /DNA_END=1474 /DNA_ORIENTATION=+